jgi:hypothetical protein
MSTAVYGEPSVEVQVAPRWVEQLGIRSAVAGTEQSARPGTSKDAADELYLHMLAEYEGIDFGPARTRTPLKEIHPI